jgi:hypothetical protein
MARRVLGRLAFSICSTLCAVFALGFLSGCGSSGGGGNGGNSATGSGLVQTGTQVQQPNNDTTSALGPAVTWSVNVPSYVQPTKQWTVLVYMNGANDLGLGNGGNDYFNAAQMEQVGSNTNLNIVLEWQAENNDGDGNNGSSIVNAAWTGTRRYYITKQPNDININGSTTSGPSTTNEAGANGSINSVLMSSNASVDTGDWQELQDFVQWGVTAFPAQHYCLILWDHGAGWRAVTLRHGARSVTPAKMTTSVPPPVSKKRASVSGRGFSFDFYTGAAIDTLHIGAGINISNTPAKKFDLVVWDCSLMQMMEVMYEMTYPQSAYLNGQSYTAPTYIVGTEESPPGTGLPYNTFLSDLSSNPSETPLAFGTDICNQDISFYNGEDYTLTTYSVVQTSELASVAQSINTLGSALTTASNANSLFAQNISAAQQTAEPYAAADANETIWYIGNQDLVNFTQLLSTSADTATFVNSGAVTNACNSVQSAVQAAVAYNTHGSMHPHSNGIAIWDPDPLYYAYGEWDQENENGPTSVPYTGLAFAQAAPNWVNFISGGNPNAATQPP